MDTPGERLKLLRNELALTQKSLGKRLGLSWYQIKDMESGKVKISPTIAKLIKYETGYNFEWLLFGTGDKKNEQAENVVSIDPAERILAKVVESTGINPEEYEKKFILNIIRKELSKAENKAEDKTKDFLKIVGR